MPTIIQTVQISYTLLLIRLQQFDLLYQSLTRSHVLGKSPYRLLHSSKLFVCSTIIGVGRHNGWDS